jgi:hypothetical protein
MTVPPPGRQTPAADPLDALRGSDRVELGLEAALAALSRLDRLGRRYGPVVRHGGRAAFLLAPGTAELVPELLGWLGWGDGLGLDLRPCAAETPRVPRQRGTEDQPPRPGQRRRRPDGLRTSWLRLGRPGPGLDLRSPDLLRLLDGLAQAAFARSYASRMSLGTRPRSLTV